MEASATEASAIAIAAMRRLAGNRTRSSNPEQRLLALSSARRTTAPGARRAAVARQEATRSTVLETTHAR